MTDELDRCGRHPGFSVKTRLLSREAPGEHLNPRGLFRGIGSQSGRSERAVPGEEPCGGCRPETGGHWPSQRLSFCTLTGPLPGSQQKNGSRISEAKRGF